LECVSSKWRILEEHNPIENIDCTLKMPWYVKCNLFMEESMSIVREFSDSRPSKSLVLKWFYLPSTDIEVHINSRKRNLLDPEERTFF